MRRQIKLFAAYLSSYKQFTDPVVLDPESVIDGRHNSKNIFFLCTFINQFGCYFQNSIYLIALKQTQENNSNPLLTKDSALGLK